MFINFGLVAAQSLRNEQTDKSDVRWLNYITPITPKIEESRLSELHKNQTAKVAR
jgi:hypothetical protein